MACSAHKSPSTALSEGALLMNLIEGVMVDPWLGQVGAKETPRESQAGTCPGHPQSWAPPSASLLSPPPHSSGSHKYEDFSPKISLKPPRSTYPLTTRNKSGLGACGAPACLPGGEPRRGDRCNLHLQPRQGFCAALNSRALLLLG